MLTFTEFILSISGAIILISIVAFIIRKLGGTGPSMREAIQMYIDSKNKRLDYCKNYMRIGEEVKFNDRKCIVQEIKYLSETVNIKDIETSEVLSDVNFLDHRLKLNLIL